MDKQRQEAKEEELAQRIKQLEENGGMPQRAPEKPVSSHGVIVHGEPNMMVRFAQCCSPVPGDDIIGYITRGRGVSVHRRDCPTPKTADDEGR
jgi:GTP pyrophosphokinase